MKQRYKNLVFLLIILIIYPGINNAQQINTYTGNLFNGKIGNTIYDSRPAWPPPIMAKAGSPNILLIVLDDAGFAQLGSYGGLINTPEMDKLAEEGLRYNNFHTASVCSSTRACLLTGRNAHSNGMGCIGEFATGYPGYNGMIPFENGFIPEILKANGYATFAIGKWHLAPELDKNMAADKSRWPLGRGFERYYGFLGGDTHQFYPDLVYDNHYVDPPATPEQGYILTDDLTDKAIGFIKDLKAVAPEKPFFLYYSPGAVHAPHQAPKEWIRKYAGKFDMGWDEARQMILAKQKELGIVPSNTALTKREATIPAWDSLSEKQQALYTYMMEIFAGMMEHTDYNIGRLLQFLDESGERENTLVILLSDNGASAEGGPNGLLNEAAFFNGDFQSVDYLWENRERLGGPQSYNHYPVGWALAGDTPFKRWKRTVYLGGIRDPLIISWPAKIKDTGDIRSQYIHAIDLMPTLLEITGIKPPDTLNGYVQSPIEGCSFMETFYQADATEIRMTQYYEMFASRSIYHAGWWAVSPHKFNTPITEEELANAGWELYDMRSDFYQSADLAGRYPEKVALLDSIWWEEARKYDVLPLDGRAVIRMYTPRPSFVAPRDTFVYYPGTSLIKLSVAAPTLNQSYSIVAEIGDFSKETQGVILAEAGSFGGLSLYISDGYLVFDYNWIGREVYSVRSEKPLPVGDIRVEMRFMRDQGKERGLGGEVMLFINGKPAGKGSLPHTNQNIYWPSSEGMTCGYDGLTPVSEAYQPPFRFTGQLKKVTVIPLGP